MSASHPRRPALNLFGAIAGPIGWIAVFSFFLNLLYLAAPLYMMQVYDRVLRSQSIPTLLYLTGAVALSYLALAVLDGVRGQILAGISDIVEHRLAGMLLHQATAPIVAGSIRPGAGLIGRDLDTVRQFSAGPAVLAFIDLPWVPLYLGVISLLHWGMGVFAISAALILLALSGLAERAARRPMAEANRVAGRAYQFGDVIARHADCASTMGLGPRLALRWQQLRQDMLDAQNKASNRAVVLGAAARFARMFTQSAILGFGAWLAINHEISSGAVFAGSLILGRTLAPVEAVIGAWRSTLAARDAFARIAAVASTPTPPTIFLPSPVGELTLEDVTWTPLGSERPALRNITLRVEAGAVLVVIGPSAAGKSSLARVLSGSLRPNQGIVRLDLTEISAWNIEQLGQAIGYLPQDVALFPGTIRDNIARFGNATDEAIVSAARAARAHEMIAKLPAGYQTVIDEASALLSGGQRQRVALARALMSDPPVLVLDEPNANLDAEGEAALIACVVEARQRRRTVIMVTHNAALVRVADYVATMVGGHIMRIQKTSDFLNRPVVIAPSQSHQPIPAAAIAS